MPGPRTSGIDSAKYPRAATHPAKTPSVHLTSAPILNDLVCAAAIRLLSFEASANLASTALQAGSRLAATPPRRQHDLAAGRHPCTSVRQEPTAGEAVCAPATREAAELAELVEDPLYSAARADWTGSPRDRGIATVAGIVALHRPE